jgi:hypothetical protein
MLVVILAALGVPLWLCALALLTLVLRNRELRKRPGNVPVRARPSNKKRWTPGHGVWIHDVFAFRGLPAGWKEGLAWAVDASVRETTQQERKRLHRIGDEPVVVTLTLREGGTIEFAARAERTDVLLGPFASSTRASAVAATT